MKAYDLSDEPSQTVKVYTAICSECPKRFYSPRPQKKTCSPECSKKRNKRLKKEAYAENPEEFKARMKAYRESPKGKAYAEKSKEDNKARSQKWREKNK